MHHQGYSIRFAAVVFFASVLGCDLILNLDEYERAETSGQGGGTTQGGGGTATTTTHGGGGNTTTSEGGSGTTTTTTDPCTDEVQNGDETDVDCGGSEMCSPCPLGKKCLAATDCQMGYSCTDGVCCDGQCSGICAACSNASTGQLNGMCAFIKSGMHDDSCTAAENKACDGQGACKLDEGQSCSAPSDCASGYCTDGYCCDGACTGLCESCKLVNEEGACSKVPAGSDPDIECSAAAPADNCDGAGTCGLGPQGGTCVAGMDSACQTGFCKDGYCCDIACNDQKCQACRGEDTGFPNGTCAGVTVGDPENECPGDANCIGNNQCEM